MAQRVYNGRAAEDGGLVGRRGWFVGHFTGPQAGLAYTRDVEIKWGVHPAGESKTSTAANRSATTLSILVSGAFRVVFPEDGLEVNLVDPGDYVVWAPGVAHTWQALKETTILTVRWPSLPDDQYATGTEPRGDRKEES